MDQWEQLRQQCMSCRACGLADTRTNVVFGVGSPTAEVLLELMQPKILVCLGRISAAEIIKPDFRITQEHGQFFEKNGMWMTALYHPAALLRDPGKKPETFQDLKRLQAKIREVCTRTPMEFA